MMPLSRKPLPPFQKRTYKSLGSFFTDLGALLRHRHAIPSAMKGAFISFPFRERLMMVVTEVNDCRYCRAFHRGQAIQAGISTREIAIISRGGLPEDIPPREVPALTYARHWAEAEGRPSGEEGTLFRRSYSQAERDAIHVILYMIRIGNLTGNTLDAVLYTLSRGRWGRPERKIVPPVPFQDRE